jgi:hypothetical protein
MNYSRDLRRLMRQQRITRFKYQALAAIKPVMWMVTYLSILAIWMTLE